MLNNIFSSIITSGSITVVEFLITTAVALGCGFVIALFYMIKNKYSKSFVVTLTLLPAIVGMVIILVNGNIGAGVAVAGAFSLVRFRSAPGKGQEITEIFLAMAVGLATGMGYVGIAVLFTFIVAVINLLLNISPFGGKESEERLLKITVPENLDFEGKFEDLLERHFEEYRIEEVKTTNMGSLYKITIRVVLKANESIKSILDEVRTRNGNLEVALTRPETKADEL